MERANVSATGDAEEEATRREFELNGVDDNRVVMRHRIALNLDGFRAVPDGFESRPAAEESVLEPVRSPFLSVVIPNFNGERLLPALMDSLERQTFRDFEVILVDDASSDGSLAWIEERMADAARARGVAHFPDMRLIVNRHNEGFAKSCNTGAGVARGRVVVLLNSDANPEPEWMAALVKAVCGNPQAGLFASKVLLMDRPDTLHTTGDMMGANGLPINRGVWERDLGQYDRRTSVFGGSGCALAIRTELWDALGGFDEDFWMYLEDVDFAFRAQLLGAQGVFVPEARVHHRLTATAGGSLASYYVGRNTIWVIAKNMPRGLLVRNWIEIVAGQLNIAVDALRNVRGAEARARLAGQVMGVLTLGRVLRKRRAVQERRRVADEVLRKRLYG